MKTYKYKSYDEYVKCQKAAYSKKIGNVWAKEENIRFIASWLNKRYENKNLKGLCHGVRQGWECVWFFDNLKKISGVMGTDIGKPLKNYIFQHDFNKINVALIGKFDFIYSNSFDHAYDPKKTFNIWADQLKPGGVIILEYDRRQEHTGEISQKVNKTDPVSIKFTELIKLIPKWNKNARVIEILDMPIVTQEWRKAVVIEVRS